jgi:RND family efflux transporter MFP subunit
MRRRGNGVDEIDEVSVVARQSRRSGRRTGIALPALALLTATAGWLHPGALGIAPEARAAAPTPQVVAATPLQRDVDVQLGFLGQFAAVNAVEIRAQVGGTLTGISFRDGDIVHKNDLLFTIDPVPYEIKLAEAKAELESASARASLAERELSRAQTLQRGDAGSIENVDQRVSDRRAAQASIDTAQAHIRDAQFDLDHCRIIAPVTGRIGTHLVSTGNLVAGSRTASSPTTLLATLVSLDPIWLTFDMSESDYNLYQRNRPASGDGRGRTVTVQPNGEAGYTRSGVLDFIDNAIDRSSGVIHARATLANPSFDLTPGSFARLRLSVAPPAPALLVPDASVLPDQSRHIVLTVGKDGTVAAKLVEIGDLRGALRVIRSGLAPDDRVIIEGLVYAAPGSKVKVTGGVIHDDAHPQD